MTHNDLRWICNSVRLSWRRTTVLASRRSTSILSDHARRSANQGAWTRLARCYLEQRRFADAAGALATVLDLNPSNTIAKSLLSEVTKRRAMALPAAEALSGSPPPDFDALVTSRQSKRRARSDPNRGAAVVHERTAHRGADRGGAEPCRSAGSKLFHRNSYHEGGDGLVYAYHHGGRWEPQFNLGFLSANPWSGDWMRIGLGFNLAASSGREDQAGGQEGMVRYFEIFQQQLASAWRRHLADWMATSGVHPVRRPRSGDRFASAAGGRMVDELPQPGGARMDFCRTLAVDVERGCRDSRDMRSW